jgi:hypothetical protein
MSVAPLPPREWLERANLVARIMREYIGIALIAAVIGVYFGWLRSPLFEEVRGNQRMLIEHDKHALEIIAIRSEESRRITEALARITEVLKMIDCGDIKDAALRERCLRR